MALVAARRIYHIVWVQNELFIACIVPQEGKEYPLAFSPWGLALVQ
jgi:hypothetical protein